MYLYIGGAAAAVLILGVVAYFLFSKPAQVTSNIAVELIYDSGILKL